MGGEAIADDYAATKCAYLDTLGKCEAAGFSFLPIVFEAHGGGGGAQTRKTLGFIGHQLAAAGDWCPEGPPLRLAQRVSCSLQRETARAILRRMAPPVDLNSGKLPYEVDDAESDLGP